MPSQILTFPYNNFSILNLKRYISINIKKYLINYFSNKINIL